VVAVFLELLLEALKVVDVFSNFCKWLNARARCGVVLIEYW
jgi:hypothetical protein